MFAIRHRKTVLCRNDTQNPVSWQVSADGQCMIGHMILRKNLDGEDILGLKIVGGKTLSSTRKGAVIEKVKRGSIADQEGHLKPGKTQLFCFPPSYPSATTTHHPPLLQNKSKLC